MRFSVRRRTAENTTGVPSFFHRNSVCITVLAGPQEMRSHGRLGLTSGPFVRFGVRAGVPSCALQTVTLVRPSSVPLT